MPPLRPCTQGAPIALTAEQLKRAILSGQPELLNLAQRYLDLQDAEGGRHNFAAFVRLFWPAVSTGTLRTGFYLDALCDHLQHLTELKRLLVNIPPRHGKSTLISVLLPAWMWITRPEIKFLCSSYSLQLSLRDSVYCRTVIESPVYQRLYGQGFALLKDQNTKHRFETDHKGFRLATSVESAVVGEGADVLLADDLNNVRKVGSDLERAKVINWWCQVMSTRMNPGGLDCKVVVQQRCHEEDVSGYILEQDGGRWCKLVMPYEFDPGRRTVTSLWSDPRTKPGQPLSDLLTDGWVDELKGGNGLGPTGFSCQYNQRAAPAEGNLFRRSWFNFYTSTPHPEGGTVYHLRNKQVNSVDCWRMAVADLAISEDQGADYTAVQVYDVAEGGEMILLHQLRQRLAGPEVLHALKALCESWKPAWLGVEDVAYQRLTIQLLAREGLPVRSLKPQGLDKQARSQTAQAKAESGHVYLPNTEWAELFLDEALSFPNGRFDDLLDCFAYAAIAAWEDAQFRFRGPLRIKKPRSRLYG